jgi:hypothetical protein
MLRFFNFKWQLKVIYFMSKFSGYLFTTINFESSRVERQENGFDFLILVMSFVFSFSASRFIIIIISGGPSPGRYPNGKHLGQ